MKKATKILSGTLLVALMSLGLATKVNARNTNLEVRDVLTQDMTKPVTGKVVRRAADEEAANKISVVKAQVSAENEGKRHIRFVAGLDSAAYADVKFDILAKDGVATVKRFTNLSVTSAYTHIEAAGEVLAAADVFGADYNYLVAYTINNVPESAWGYTFEVTVSSKAAEDAEYTTSEVASKVINEVAEKDEVAGVTLDLTSSIIEKYNYEAIRDSEELYEGTTSGKLLIGDVDSGRVYSGIGASLGQQIDIKGAIISFFVKLDSNVYKNRISVSFINDESNQLKIILTDGSGNGYTVEPLENNWYRVEIDVDRAWATASYLSEELLIVTANQDTTAAVRLIIADFKLALPAGTVEEETPEVTGHDYTNELYADYGCELTTDAANTITGAGSKAFTLLSNASKDTGRVRFVANKALAGHNLSFYTKIVDGTLYKNRISVQFRDAAEKVKLEIRVELGKAAPTGATITSVGDGWYHIVVDCDAVGVGDTVIEKVGFVIVNLEGEKIEVDGEEQYLPVDAPASIWLEQVVISAK